MKKGKGFKYVPVAAIVGLIGVTVASNGCSAASNLAGAAQGCDEFNGGVSAVANLSIDANTKALVTSAADLVAIANTIETDVLNACIAIDTDLGVTDTWTAMKPTDGSAPDNELKEACTQASNKINAILMAGQSAMVTCDLSVSGGECHVDANVQAMCEANCNVMGMCTPGDVTVRCDPGQLTGECDAMCNASATCEGSVNVQANCQGSCEADCTGMCSPGMLPSVTCNGSCSGTCMGTCMGGTMMGGMCSGKCMGKCMGTCAIDPGSPIKCEGSCMGKCSGSCKLDANAMVNCGAMVNCKGGCSVMYKSPSCEAKLNPPMCNIDAHCEAGCQSHAEVNAMCTPPTVSLECQGTTMGDIPKLIATLEKNLPAIVSAVISQGKLALDAAGAVVNATGAVVANVGNLTGKAIACATVAAQASVKASASVNVSVMASASVSGSAGGPSS